MVLILEQKKVRVIFSMRSNVKKHDPDAVVKKTGSVTEPQKTIRIHFSLGSDPNLVFLMVGSGSSFLYIWIRIGVNSTKPIFSP